MSELGLPWWLWILIIIIAAICCWLIWCCKKRRRRRVILLFGYWPPTDIGIDTRHGMLWKWRTRQVNYRNSGYDVLAISPTFQNPLGWSDLARTVPYWGKGTGQLQVDYRGTSQDFWMIVQQHRPVAIMSFSRGSNDRSWEIEAGARNLRQSDWILNLTYRDASSALQTTNWDQPYAGGGASDPSPYQGRGAAADNPPDPSRAAGSRRDSNLPTTAIRDAVNAHFPIPPGSVVAAIDPSGNVGQFVSEFMAYHVAWYREYSQANLRPDEQCLYAGHTHVGVQVTAQDGEQAVEIQLNELLSVLP